MLHIVCLLVNQLDKTVYTNFMSCHRTVVDSEVYFKVPHY
jgi:hypothetical protein